MAPKQRVTIKTVAADAGVSVSAVSKVLRNAYGVSDDLRERVTASMDKLGYRPSIMARGMRGKSYTIGVIMSDTRNAFYADLLEGIDAAFHPTQYQALIGVSHHETSTEAHLFDAMLDRQVDGIIVIGPRLWVEGSDKKEVDPSNLIETSKRVPTVVIGYHGEHPLIDTVNGDDFAGGKAATLHLIEQGHERIAFVSPEAPDTPRVSVAQFRYQGYVEAMREHGLDRHVSVVIGREIKHSIRTSMEGIFSSKARPDALFCWCDAVAFDTMSAVLELGYDIPGDVAIVGYDNTAPCNYHQNALSSVDQAGQALGLQAARLLLERIGGRTTPVHFVLPPRLVARRSSIGSQKQ